MHVFWFGNNAANMIERRLRQSVVGLAVRDAKRGMHRQTGCYSITSGNTSYVMCKCKILTFF